MDKYQKLRLAAEEFANKARTLSTILEIAIIGSVASTDPYPNDLDLAVIVRGLDDLVPLAKYARQLSAHYHAWNVFLFDENLAYLGRICFRKTCPTNSVDCAVPGCGEPPHLRVIKGFEFDARVFYTSPFITLLSDRDAAPTRFLARKTELGIEGEREYETHEDIEQTCVVCGELFTITGEEQKWHLGRGLHLPKRCEECLMDEKMRGLRDF